MRIITAFSLLAVLIGCGSKKEPEKVVEGESISKNPVGFMAQMAKAGSDLEKVQKEMENMKPVEAVSFTELMPFLPEPPAGWEGQKPRGQSNTMGEWKFSEVERNYTMGEKRMEVKILDWAFRRELYAPFFMMASFSQESTEGYNKGIKINDDPGREEYKTDSKNGELSVLVGKRFLVSVRGNNIAAAELREWWDKVDTKALRAKAAQ
ncbi:MAG: hypothetical protein ABI972_25670 [Acidobacteriota bacterium]